MSFGALKQCPHCGRSYHYSLKRCPACSNAAPAGEFERSKFYCSHCPLVPDAPSYANAYVCRTHISETHGVDHAKAEEGVDFYQGWQAFKKWDARQTVAAAELRLPWRGDDNYGADDFLTDIGEASFESRLKYEDDE